MYLLKKWKNLKIVLDYIINQVNVAKYNNDQLLLWCCYLYLGQHNVTYTAHNNLKDTNNDNSTYKSKS